ncbi:hypothetical protein LVY72_14605 [Arthrobacter sp. I2-34]|uniref:Uncharacterized protein n=1 Tax=Arthrobacter hankyongi TaxID=2904801 RepID=A0ABS9L8X2_9MICC|nr:hypothetical protein [Arthrobacter hankyongi]MCG2623130.1 hypothetical protein [Arthrobacter hankyongi]
MAANVLSLVERQVTSTAWKRHRLFFRRAVETTDVHLDFAIDSKPLRDWIQEWEGADKAPGEVSLLTPDRPDLAVEQIDRLLGGTPHQYWDRAWLLFCAYCWDEGCGGVTADITRRDGMVYWSNLGWNFSYEQDTNLIPKAAVFAFDEREYDRVLLEARERFRRTA